MRRPTHSAALLLPIIAAIACNDRQPTTAPARPPTPAVSPTALARADDFSHIDSDALSGGATTVFDITAEAFGFPAPNLDARALARHNDGDEAFDAVFVSAKGTPNSGLGPLFNNNACASCHVGDGRGRPPNPGEAFETMLFRASIPGEDAFGGPVGAGKFGGQLQVDAIFGYRPEASARVTYVDSGGRFDDGKHYSLRVPRYSFQGLLGSLPSNLLTSPRVAPVNFGLGLLEAIPEATLRNSG